MHAVGPVFRAIFIRIDVSVIKHRDAIAALDDHLHIPDVLLAAAAGFGGLVAFAARTASAKPASSEGNRRIVQCRVVTAEIDRDESGGWLFLVRRHDEQVDRRRPFRTVMDRDFLLRRLAAEQLFDSMSLRADRRRLGQVAIHVMLKEPLQFRPAFRHPVLFRRHLCSVHHRERIGERRDDGEV